MLVNGERTSADDFLTTLQNLKKNGYFIAVGMSDTTGNLLVSAKKAGRVIDNKTFVVTGLTISVRQRVIDVVHKWDYITLNPSSKKKGNVSSSKFLRNG